MKLIYVEPAEYFTPSMKKILEAGETETASMSSKKSAKKQSKKTPKKEE